MCLTTITERYRPGNKSEVVGYQVKRMKIDDDGKVRFAPLFLHDDRRCNKPLRFTKFVKHKTTKRIFASHEDKSYIPGYHLFLNQKDATSLYNEKLKSWPTATVNELCICEVLAKGKICRGTQFNGANTLVAKEIAVIKIVKKFKR